MIIVIVMLHIDGRRCTVKMEVRLFLLATLSTVVLGRVPPLASLPGDVLESAGESLRLPNHNFINFGLNGAVTEEDWEMATVYDDEPPIIEHPNLNGSNETVTIIGKKMLTINGRTINAFQGIRFGEPPVDELRFKKPIPAAPYWENNTLMANHLGEKCSQIAMFGPVGAGSEDCLSLNVYTPYLPDELPAGELPVMMWIHGGAFTMGDSSLYLPTKLLDNDVILVVIHYRLGTLGFFSLQTDDAPGNAGLWDQIEAMKWIQNNIEGFGGNKHRVTIFGESAGSASVNWQLVLPASKNLFHGVIGESGSALEHWGLDPEPLVSARLVAGRNGCPNDTSVTEEEIFECMITIPHEELSLNFAQFVNEDRQRGEMGFRGAAPVIDAVPGVSEPLISKPAEEYYADGDASDVPLLIGANKHEGSFVLAIMYLEYFVPHGLINDSIYMNEGMIPDILNAFGVHDQTNGISESLIDAYFGGTIEDYYAASSGMIDLAGVLFLKAGAWQTAKKHAKYLTSNTYVYSFDFHSDDSMFKWLFMGHDEIPFAPGVTHSDELLYLFSFPAVMEGKQITTMQRLTTLWTNFAIYGDPTPMEDKESWQSLNIPFWKPLTRFDHNYMLIQDECTMEKEYPDRWHITVEESVGNETTVTTTVTPVPTESTTRGPTQEDYDQVEQERQAFMISMIVFIVATVIFGVGCAYLFFKSR
ncbi:Carboxylesterase 5A [Halocaridina rubra]|uniref:Carboxylic ester hydrolase n=1 Tax=Halocaridina rubra TaxID=373956 RepID=A0AAN9A961_HALRR